jgi:hypothetical protein
MTAVHVDLVFSGDMGGNVIRYFGIVTSFLYNYSSHFIYVNHAIRAQGAKSLELSMLNVG